MTDDQMRELFNRSKYGVPDNVPDVVKRLVERQFELWAEGYRAASEAAPVTPEPLREALKYLQQFLTSYEDCFNPGESIKAEQSLDTIRAALGDPT